MMNRPHVHISRGEVWLVNFDPTVGDEIQKIRPAVVVSIAAVFRHRLRIVVPITGWQDKFSNDFWMVRLTPAVDNGLDKDSAANTYQTKSISEERFVRKIGILPDSVLDDITAAIAVCIGFNPAD